MPTDSNNLAQKREYLVHVVQSLSSRAKVLRDTALVRLGDSECVAFHARKANEARRNHRTRNNRLFAFGANAEVGGYVDLDDLAISGLEAHGALYCYWMAKAALARPEASRGELLAAILARPVRLDWCRREGAAVRWRWTKARREEETAGFKARQEAGGSKAWKRQQPTELQLYLIELICVRGGLDNPSPSKRGDAFSWIDNQGGHPDFWSLPTEPPSWT